MNERYQLTPTPIECPACRGREGLLLYTVDAATAAQHYVLHEVHPERHRALEAHIATLWGQPACDLVRCARCGLVSADPYVAGDARFYDLAYERTGYPAWKWEFAQTRDALQRLRSEGALGDFTLLELGAGDGAFVRRIAPELIPPSHVLCTEYSPYGRDAIERLGVACRMQDVRALPLDEFAGRFDVICLFQVLEHLDRLDALFERFGQLSTPAGQVFIAVPNDARVTFNETHGSLLDMPPNHIGRWTRPAFEAIAGRHGWRVEAHAVEPERRRAQVARYITYRYMRKRQDSGAWANRIERIRPAPLRRGAQAAAAALYALGAWRQIAALVQTPGLGDSQWVHLRKA
ncbi:MAG: class I SAM-dependent methyltransferase [Rhodothermales bacterium]